LAISVIGREVCVKIYWGYELPVVALLILIDRDLWTVVGRVGSCSVPFVEVLKPRFDSFFGGEGELRSMPRAKFGVVGLERDFKVETLVLDELLCVVDELHGFVEYCALHDE